MADFGILVHPGFSWCLRGSWQAQKIMSRGSVRGSLQWTADVATENVPNLPFNGFTHLDNNGFTHVYLG